METTALILIACIFITPFVLLVGMEFARKSWECKLVKRGLALYDPQTGKWRWKEQGE